MSLGAGILWSTIILVTFASVYLISRAKKWLLVGKIFALIVVVSAAVYLGTWAWRNYKDRPQTVSELGGVSIGMKPVEIKLALGEPSYDTTAQASDRREMVFSKNSGKLFVIFEIVDGNELAKIICSTDYRDEVFGLGKYDTEKRILRKLGTPVATSVNASGLGKMISYPKWKVSFEVEKGAVTSVCISKDGTVNFVDEYQE